ncbi:MAG: aminoacetone oxidase family FAD-binding enzyme [Firmicutes bacterium]|nr:aminoacetone oxidase family FAD-binding enzyme [Bacillota bacterium]
MIYDCIVIGGGPSGLMACNVLEKHHINYLLLEKNDTLGKKLLLSGGKRCNVTNNLPVEEFINATTLKHKRFLSSALHLFGPSQIIQYFEEHDCELVLENNFKYFPKTQKSQSILSVFQQELSPSRIKLNHAVKSIDYMDDLYSVKTNQIEYLTKKVIIATGSSSYPSTGSNGDGLRFAKDLGIQYKEFTPAETHIYASEVSEQLLDLQAVSLEQTTVKILGTKIENTGGLIFTHFGLSGPAILHSAESIYEQLLLGEVKISFNLITETREELNQLFEQGKKENTPILKILESVTTKRLAKKVLELSKIDNKNISEISKKDLQVLSDYLLAFTLKVDSVQTKDKAFVNAGGILTKELSPKSFETKKHQGCYFIGETVDIHGPIGGFNITIALSTGFLCATSIVDEIKG